MYYRQHKSGLALLFIIFFLLADLSALDLRSIWVTPWDITSPQKIDKLVADCVENNINEILAEVRYRGDALYIPNKSNNRFINNESRSYVLEDKNFDPLDYLIDKAKQHSIRVQAWMTVLVVTPASTERLDRAHIYFKKREWITYSADQKIMATNDLEGAYLDPGIPEVRDYLADIFADVALNYEVDGIHLDYLRYPDHRYGFNPSAIKSYNDEKIKQTDLNWEKWKEQQISETVKAISKRVKSIKPKMQISVAVKPDPRSAQRYFGQNWTDWLEKNYVDRVYLMAYHTKDDSFNQLISSLPEQYNDKMIMGIRAWSDNSSYPAYLLKNKLVSVINSSLKGVAFFSYAGINKDAYFSVIYPLLQDMPANEIVEHEEGIYLIAGKVIGLNDQPISGAKVTHLESMQQSFTDSNGDFLISDILEKDNQIRIQYFDQNKIFSANVNHSSEIKIFNQFKLNVFPANSLSVELKAYSDNKKVFLAWISKDKKAYSLYRKRVYSPLHGIDKDYQFLGLMSKDKNTFVDTALEPFTLYEYKLIDDQLITSGFARVELDFTRHPLEFSFTKVKMLKQDGAEKMLQGISLDELISEYDFNLSANDSLDIKWSIMDFNEKPLSYGISKVKEGLLKWNGLSTEGDIPDSPIFIFEYQVLGQKKWFRKFFY